MHIPVQQIEYTIHRLEHGWVVCGAPGRFGVPVSRISEIAKIASKSAVMHSGIARALNEAGFNPPVAFAIAEKRDIKAWTSLIEATIETLPPQERWWKGLHVGMSSAALFAVFAGEPWKSKANDYGRGSFPRDLSDLRCCQRLLESFPEWKTHLQCVSEKYPDTRWPLLIERWDELGAATADDQRRILDEILKTPNQVVAA